MTTIKIASHGEFSATEKMMARFNEMTKRDLVKRIAEAYAGRPQSEGPGGVAHWRTFPKDTLVVVAADLFATDEERAAEKPAAPVAEAQPAPVQAAPEVPAETEPKAKKAPKQGQQQPAQKPASKREQDRGTFLLRIVKTRPSFSAQIPEGLFLRRDQPRKPGDSAKYRGVEQASATVYRSRFQVNGKLAELASLYDGLRVEVVEA